MSEQSPLSPIGTWSISSAQTLDGRPYSGTVQISEVNQLYTVSWLTTIGDFAGIGFFEENHLFAGWGMGQDYGVMLYKIGSDGSLSGRWATPSSRGVHRETATGGSAGEVAGTYQILGEINDRQYQGSLKVEAVNDCYRFSWELEIGMRYEGVGLRWQDWLLASWGNQRTSNAIEYAFEPNRAKGRWAQLNQTTTGQELLERIC